MIFFFFFHARADQSLLKICAKFLGKVTRIKVVTAREDHIFVNVHSLKFRTLILWFQSTFPLIMMRIIQSLNKKFGKYFQKSMNVKASKK